MKSLKELRKEYSEVRKKIRWLEIERRQIVWDISRNGSTALSAALRDCTDELRSFRKYANDIRSRIGNIRQGEE